MLELWDVYKHNKELLGTKTAKCNEILYVNTLN